MNLRALVILSMPHSSIILTYFARAIRLQAVGRNVLPSESTDEFAAAMAGQYLQIAGKQRLKIQSTVAGAS